MPRQRMNFEAKQRIQPRGISRSEAAAYIGVSSSLFDEMVHDGRMPKPKRINSRTVWDQWQIDEAFDAISEQDNGNPWDVPDQGSQPW